MIPTHLTAVTIRMLEQYASLVRAVALDISFNVTMHHCTDSCIPTSLYLMFYKRE